MQLFSCIVPVWHDLLQLLKHKPGTQNTTKMFAFVLVSFLMFYCVSVPLSTQSDLEMIKHALQQGWGVIFTHLHRIWTIVSFEFLLSALVKSVPTRLPQFAESLINGGQGGFLRELLLYWLDGLTRWMDRLVGEWADQWLVLYLNDATNYITEQLVNFTVCIHLQCIFSASESYSFLGDAQNGCQPVGDSGIYRIKWKQRIANLSTTACKSDNRLILVSL